MKEKTNANDSRIHALPRGFIEELPGANTQGATLDETRANLKEAVQLVLETNRELAKQSVVGKVVSREPFDLSAQ